MHLLPTLIICLGLGMDAMWICEKREGVILARLLLPEAVLQELRYKIICSGGLKEQRKEKKVQFVLINLCCYFGDQAEIFV